MEIVPIRDLKDTAKIEKLCKTCMKPVFVTKNGQGNLVIMDINLFEQFVNDLYETKKILEGLEDVKQGKIKRGNLVLEEMKTKYGL